MFLDSGNKSMKLGDDFVSYNKDFEESNEVIVAAYGYSKNSLLGQSKIESGVIGNRVKISNYQILKV